MQSFLKKAIGHTLQHWLSWSPLNIMIDTNTVCSQSIRSSVAHGNRPSMLYPQHLVSQCAHVQFEWDEHLSFANQHNKLYLGLCVFITPIHPVCLRVHSNPNTLNDSGQSSNYAQLRMCQKVLPSSNSNCKWVNSTPHRPLYLSPPSSPTAVITQNRFKGQN